MTVTAFILIFISVFLHAGWNFLSKKSSPSTAFYCIANGIGAVIWLFAIPASGIQWGALTAGFWIFFLIAILFNVLYFTGLACGYKAGDISLVYPLGRALPVILTAAVTVLFHLGKAPSWGAIGGMVVIFAGCILMPLKSLKDFTWRTYCTKLLFFILLIAIGTTGYTVFDSLAMKELCSIPAKSDAWRSMFYIFMVEAGVSVALFIMSLFMKEQRKELVRLIGKDLQPYLAGLFISLAYGLVLYSMCHVTNVSFVQAFRQMSLPLGVLAGILFLKESCTVPKIAGITLIVLGLVGVAFLK